MDFLIPEMQVLLWTVVVFVLLLIVLTKYAWGPLMTALQEREDRIAKKISDAETAHKTALSKLAEYEKRIAAEKDQAAAIIAEAKKDADKVKEEIQAAAKAEAERMIERAKREIELAQQAAVAEIRDRMVDLAAEMASVVVQREIKSDDHRRYIQEAIGNIEKSASTN